MKQSALLGLLLAGCASAPMDIPLREALLYQSSHCGREQSSAGIEWITTPERYREAFARASTGREATLPPVNFGRAGVLLVEMGRKPTAGYALEPLRIEDDGSTVTVHTRWQNPPPDAMTAQVITSPCFLLRLPQADYAQIRVVDEQGLERLDAL